MLFVEQCMLDVKPRHLIDQNQTKLLYQGNVRTEAEMTFIDEHTYIKRIFDGVKQYTFRRIIDGDGLETSNWSKFAANYIKKKSPGGNYSHTGIVRVRAKVVALIHSRF